jgi:DNA helicase-2/ATP-dependent DNA helicase PcrA
VANPADDLAWFRLLRLHDGVGPGHARRVLDVLDPDTSGQHLPPEDWPRAAEAVPARARPALTVTLGQLAAVAGDRAVGEPAAAQAEAIVTILDPLIRARYPDAAARLADLRRLADAAAAQPSLHDALAELTLDPPVSGSDLAGPPRLDEDYLTISTIHAAKGLEWPVVHVPHLVDGALPSDMALGDPGGLAEEHRLFYVALTRARDHLYLYAPLRLHHHRRGRDDRHGYGQLTRFLHRDALAACDNIAAAPPAPVLPVVGPIRVQVDAALGSLWDG